MTIWLNVPWFRSFVGVVIGVGTILTCAQGARGQVAYEVFHAFTNGGGTGEEGCCPTSPLIQASDGNFYGTTLGGGATNGGTVFKITAAGTLTTLHSFDERSTEGSPPPAGLIQASDGNFYGTTEGGGAVGCGTAFKITPAGILSTLHPFDGDTEGCNPHAGLIQASDSNFYGTTNGGGGTVFKITAAGTLTTLHSFDCSTEGCQPFAGLIQASDGNFYGTTREGGGGGGTIFKIAAAGTCCRTPKGAGIWTDAGDHDVGGLARGALRVTSAARRR